MWDTLKYFIHSNYKKRLSGQAGKTGRIENEFIGNVGCTYFEDSDKIGICYFAGTGFRRKGYVSEAVRAYVQYFFEHYNEDEIEAVIKENNIPSWKVADNTGFKLLETRMHKDIGDEREELYRFYTLKKREIKPAQRL